MNENIIIDNEQNIKLKLEQLEKIRISQRKASKKYYDKIKNLPKTDVNTSELYKNQIKYYEKHKDTINEKNRERAKKYYEANKERIKQKNLEHYYDKNKV